MKNFNRLIWPNIYTCFKDLQTGCYCHVFINEEKKTKRRLWFFNFEMLATFILDYQRKHFTDLCVNIISKSQTKVICHVHCRYVHDLDIECSQTMLHNTSQLKAERIQGLWHKALINSFFELSYHQPVPTTNRSVS